MARRTINLPDSVETIAREAAKSGESFSATVSRLIVQGAERANGLKPPSYTGAGEGPSDLGRRAEHYLQTPVSAFPRHPAANRKLETRRRRGALRRVDRAAASPFSQMRINEYPYMRLNDRSSDRLDVRSSDSGPEQGKAAVAG